MDVNKPSTRALVALILGIVGILANLAGCCCCFSLILGLCSPVAAFLGFQERKDIEGGRAPAAGQTLATVGMILGLVGTAFFALLLLFHAVNLIRVLMHGGPIWEGMRRSPWSR
jgi:hypothetical protein